MNGYEKTCGTCKHWKRLCDSPSLSSSNYGLCAEIYRLTKNAVTTQVLDGGGCLNHKFFYEDKEVDQEDQA